MGLTRPRAYQIFDIDYKQSVRVVTVSNVTLSGGAPSSVDGVSLSLNDRVLVTGQSTGSQNGLYYVTTVGSGNNGTWARSIDGNETGEIDAGMIVMVTEGTTYADTQWKLTTNDPIVIGSTALTFVLNVQANSISSGTSNVVVNANSNVTVSVAGTSNVLTVTSTGANIAGYANITGNVTVGNIAATIGSFTTFTSGQGGNVTGTLVATSANAQFINQTNAAGYATVAGYLTVVGNVTGGNVISNAVVTATGNITGGNLVTAGLASVTGNVTGGNLVTAGQVVATGNITGGNLKTSGVTISSTGVSATTVTATGNITGGNLVTTGLASVTGNITGGNLVTAGLASVTGNITGGNLVTTGLASVTGNITGGNLVTAGQVVATGTITSSGATNSTAFAVGNSAVSNVALGMFPTAGTKGDYAIRDYSTVFSNMYFDVCIGGTPNGAFQFRSSSSYNQFANINSSGINTPLAVTATGIVSGSELTSTNSQVNEGGQINLALPSSGSTLSGSVIIDVYQNKVRFFEGSGTARGAYIDLTSCSAGAGTNLLAGGGGGGTPGGSNTYVQFNDGGAFGGNSQFTYDKVTNFLTAGIVWATNNGNGTNFKVGDDVYLGDINLADTLSIRGQQNGANAYIVFGNADGVALGRAGTGPLTYGGAFTATGNITGGNISGTSIVGTLTTASQTNITSVGTLGSLTVTANIAGGNLTTAGQVVATGNITGGNLKTSGVTISSTGVSATTVTATANVAGGNLTTAGQVVATGNVSGGNINTSGSVVATGSLSGALLSTPKTIGSSTTLAASTNSLMVGPTTINNGVVLTIPDSSTLVVV